MIQTRLNELGRLIDLDPTSPQVASLAAEIKRDATTAEDRQLIDDFIGARLPRLAADIDNIHQQATRLQLGEIADMVNLSYIARTYFHRSRAWLSQRINGNTVNGKPCRLTPQELNTLNAALRDMGARLSQTTLKY